MLASDVFESYSAGTELKDHINPDAVRLMKQIHGIDMEETQYNKLIEDIPEPDVAISMGCNVSCPIVPNQYMEDWGLDDPSGKSDEVFLETIRMIEEKSTPVERKTKTCVALGSIIGTIINNANIGTCNCILIACSFAILMPFVK